MSPQMSEVELKPGIWQVNISNREIKLSRVFESRLLNCHVNANQNVINQEKMVNEETCILAI